MHDIFVWNQGGGQIFFEIYIYIYIFREFFEKYFGEGKGLRMQLTKQ